MPQYGNSAGRNKGKKYIKLTGNEIATPEAERRANHFLNWYGSFYKYMVKKWRDFDDDVATDAMLKMHHDMLYRELSAANYFKYYVRTYNTTLLARNIEAGKRRADTTRIEDNPVEIAAPDFDYALYEQQVEQLQTEMLDHVRVNYSPMEISVFEIYVGLQPDVSYTTLGSMLGISANRIYLIVSAIKRDLKEKFTERRIDLLSIV